MYGIIDWQLLNMPRGRGSIKSPGEIKESVNKAAKDLGYTKHHPLFYEISNVSAGCDIYIFKGVSLVAEDKELTCKDCGQSFTFTGGEQDFFAERGFSEPVRCKPCRDARKMQKNDRGGGFSQDRGQRSGW